ncbi:armadillo-type protein [Mycena capillaripes]|nr:armadillo-type protein [Mycena capillaripes]
MDLQTLSNLFAATLSSEPNARMAAELQIRQVGNEPGMIAALLQIIAADNIDIVTRQACSVWLKNRVRTSYAIKASTRGPHQVIIASSDRDALRGNILPLLVTSPSRSITVQLASSLRIIVADDYPERWPGLIDAIKQLLTSKHNIAHVHAGCVAALEAVRAFRYRQKRDILPNIVEALFPTLVGIASQMIQVPPTAAQEIPTMLHLILKTYKTSIGLYISPHQQNAWQSLVPWAQFLFAAVRLQIPKEAVPEDEDERVRSEWWRAKKWAYGVLGWLFRRFGNPSQLTPKMKEEYGAFAQSFMTMFVPEIVAIYLDQVKLYTSNQAWISDKCQYQIFIFFTECVNSKSTWLLLKPHAQTLIESFVFPQLSFTAAKQSLWESDPVDYARVSVDEYETFPTSVSARAFLLALVQHRTAWTFMPILAFINTVLQSNAPAAQRFGALRMSAILVPWLMRHPEVGPANLEQFLLQYVTPEFASEQPYLRVVACQVLGMVPRESLKWSSDQHLNVHIRALASALDDPEFPVRVEAVQALTEMIMHYDRVKTAVSPQVGKVIQDLLKMSEEVDLDVLNRSMGVMVETFRTELLPVAGQLTARLCDTYLRLVNESGVADEQEVAGPRDTYDDKTYAAMQVTTTILKIFSSIKSAPEILAQVQEIILPVIDFTLKRKIFVLFDSMYNFIDSLTSNSPTISPDLWPLFELTYSLFKSDAADFLHEMLRSLDNFVSQGEDVIKARPDYQRMLLDICTTAMTSEQFGADDRRNGCKLAESILFNLLGSVDDCLQPIIAAALSQLDKAEPALRVAILDVLVTAVLYDASAALHMMDISQPGAARKFLDMWSAAIQHNRMPHPMQGKRLSVWITALSVLVQLPPERVPETLKSGWAGIVAKLLNTFKDPEAPKGSGLAEEGNSEEELNSEEEDEEYDEGWDSEDELDDKMLNLKEDDEDVWDGDLACLEMLATENARLHDDIEASKSKSRVNKYNRYIMNKKQRA